METTRSLLVSGSKRVIKDAIHVHDSKSERDYPVISSGRVIRVFLARTCDFIVQGLYDNLLIN